MNQYAPAEGPVASNRDAIRVFVAEDHKITLWGLQRLISTSANMELIGSACTRNDLLNHEAVPAADVILLDLDLCGEDTSESLSDLRRRSAAHLLILTGEQDLARHRAAVVKGARGVLHKSEPAETILRAIEKVNAGEIWLHRNLMGDVLGVLTGNAARRDACPHAKRIASLTPREREIVSAMGSQPGAKQLVIADELGMSEHTLRNHLTTIYSKLALHGRLELYVYATQHGLVAPAAARVS